MTPQEMALVIDQKQAEIVRQHDEIARLRAERDALRVDAERYRWLRRHHYKHRSPNTEYDNSMLLSFHVSGVWSDNMDPRVLDGCIDAARRGKETP